jgi:hypothetical protein
MKIPPVETEFFHPDRQMDKRTDMTKLTDAFYDFLNAPKTLDTIKWEVNDV